MRTEIITHTKKIFQDILTEDELESIKVIDTGWDSPRDYLSNDYGQCQRKISVKNKAGIWAGWVNLVDPENTQFQLCN